MPYTGLFLLKDVSAQLDEGTNELKAVIAVQAICLNCRCLMRATSAPDLEVLPDGAILYCRQCGTRQVISNEHFRDFLARVSDRPGELPR